MNKSQCINGHTCAKGLLHPPIHQPDEPPTRRPTSAISSDSAKLPRIHRANWWSFSWGNCTTWRVRIQTQRPRPLPRPCSPFFGCPWTLCASFSKFFLFFCWSYATTKQMQLQRNVNTFSALTVAHSPAALNWSGKFFSDGYRSKVCVCI